MACSYGGAEQEIDEVEAVALPNLAAVVAGVAAAVGSSHVEGSCRH